MGITKTEKFTPQQNRIAILTKAIGHPARVAILQHLMKVEGCVCGDLVDALPLAQSTVSQHLKALKQVGILKGEVEGKNVCYCIDVEVWKEMKNIVNVFFNTFSCCDSSDCC